MNFYDFLISTYPAKRIAWLLLFERLPVNWNEELLDFASYSLRILLLQLLHYKIPELSVTDVMCLSYPLRRSFDVFLRKRRKFPWKMEVKAVIFNWFCYFVIEVLILKVALGRLSIVLGGSIIEPYLWTIFIWFVLLCARRLQMIFVIMIPLPKFVHYDEFFILPLCASIARYYLLLSLYYRILGIITRYVN